MIKERIKLAGKTVSERYDVVVIGGGLAGVCAAIAAARHGCKTVIIQNRPVFGGNSSSEIRVPPNGANNCNGWARETGIIEEILIEERARNHDLFISGRINSVWDLVLYEWILREPNLKYHLNTHAIGVLMKDDKHIDAVIAVQLGSEKTFLIYGKYFIDCTGDGTIGAAAGAEYRIGRESREEFNESLAPKDSDKMTQGSSLLFKSIYTGRKCIFSPPSWIERYSTEDSLYKRGHPPKDTPYGWKEYSGYWWIEVGAPFNTIEDNERIRDEVLRHLLGVWDHIKNTGIHDSEKQALDWVGMVLGKRESRRLIGDYILNQNDLESGRIFPDRIGYGGWFIDVHTMGGILAKNRAPEPSMDDPEYWEKTRVRIYSIPLRCIYSKNIENLLMAGRDISVTHVALGSTRLMLTCAILGQAAGTTASMCVKRNITPREIASNNTLIKELQQTLLKDDCYIPYVSNEDPKDLARKSKIHVSSTMPLMLEPTGEYLSLERDRSQIFPVSEDRIDEIWLYVKSNIDGVIRIELLPATDIWSFNENRVVLKSIEKNVSKGFEGWIKFNLNIKVNPKKLYQINIHGCKNIFIAKSKPIPGVTSAYKGEILGKWIQIKDVYAMRLKPLSYPYMGENVISGVARPERWTNIWISDPEKDFPQTLTIEFEDETEFNTIYLTFDTYLHADTKDFPPFYRVPECVKDYDIEVYVNNKWRKILEVRGNYHRRRIHRFGKVKSKKVRIKILSSNGDRSARIYEIRIYNE